MITAKKEKYINVTQEWLNNATPNSHEIKDCLNYNHNGVNYKVDGKYVVLDYSKKELEIASFLKETFGGTLYMIPKINVPENISTPDYLFNGKKFDLKEIKGNSFRVIDNSVKNSKKQSDSFILDISKTDLSIQNIIEQINRLYYSPQRNWINTIILIKDYALISVFTRI